MILDGKKLASKIKDNLKLEIAELTKTKSAPTLAVVIVGNNPASKIYVKNKKIACDYVGIKSKVIELSETTNQQELDNVIKKLNNDDEINGILLQLPLPNGLNERKVLNNIAPLKDVDGLTSLSLGKLMAKEDGLTPCTPTGIMTLLSDYNIDVEGKNVVIINRSLLVGKPLLQLMVNQNATVTLCHTKTKNLKFHTKHADIVVTAVGHANFLTGNMIKKGAIVIDVSMNRNENGLCGDVCFKSVNKKASYLTPVPGGVGPLTIATLMQNTLKAYKLQNLLK